MGGKGGDNPGTFGEGGGGGGGLVYLSTNYTGNITLGGGQAGNNWTGGGGGNGRYSGGGGGSNRGAGGLGGLEDCFPPLPGGNGGLKADHPSLIDRIYMGGGGGASTRAVSGTSTYGGNGGGIVIIVADGIVGNGGNILADGGRGEMKQVLEAQEEGSRRVDSTFIKHLWNKSFEVFCFGRKRWR